jgi:hypothetical protein
MANYTLGDVKKYIENELSETPCYNNVEIGDIEVNGNQAVYVLDDNRLVVIVDENGEDFRAILFISNCLSILEDEDTMYKHYVDGCVPIGLNDQLETIIHFLEDYYPEFDDANED